MARKVTLASAYGSSFRSHGMTGTSVPGGPQHQIARETQNCISKGKDSHKLLVVAPCHNYLRYNF